MTEFKVMMRDGTVHIFHDRQQYWDFCSEHHPEIDSVTIIDYIGPTHSTATG